MKPDRPGVFSCCSGLFSASSLVQRMASSKSWGGTVIECHPKAESSIGRIEHGRLEISGWIFGILYWR
jgi:hypothetical protein